MATQKNTIKETSPEPTAMPVVQPVVTERTKSPPAKKRHPRRMSHKERLAAAIKEQPNGMWGQKPGG